MIEVKNLVKVYGKNKAVDNLNFTVEKGQILGFLGPNGAGKSTTMNIITGYISATEGDVTIAGYDILREPEMAKQHIGYLPEQPPIYMDMTVREYLTFASKLKGVKKKDIEEEVEHAMDATKITTMQDRLIANLSKGYKQRVGIAAALLGNPEVLILDEPTVGLDPKQIIEIRDLIKNLAEKHTVILSSHILQEISAVCDRIIIINHGKLILDENLADLNKNIEDAQALVITARTSKTKIEEIFADKSYVREMNITNSEDSGCVDVKIYANEQMDIREDVYKALVENNITLLQMYMDKKSLEDIFIEATTDVDEPIDYDDEELLDIEDDEIDGEKSSDTEDNKIDNEENGIEENPDDNVDKEDE